MEFYSRIAEQYDLIFPFSPPQKKFVQSSVSAPLEEKNILDIGCGTGNLTIELSPLVNSITGIDLNPEMIKAAQQKSDQPTFLCRNMLDLSKDFPPASFDTVLCFGNTVVHLDGMAQIAEFFSQVRKILKPNGKILLQIINYDRILTYKIDHLPTIENNHIKFERFYIYQEDIHRVNFDTRLTLKVSGEVIENSVQLYPILKDELKQVLIDSSFDTLHWYGNFKKEPLTNQAVPLVLEAF